MKKFILILAVLLVPILAQAADVTVEKLGPAPTSITGSIDGHVVDVNNGDLANAHTDYLYMPLFKYGFNAFAMTVGITATTLTFECSNSANVSDLSSMTYVDCTQMVTGGATSTITTDGTVTVSSPLPWNVIRIKRLTTNATNALDVFLTRMRIN